MADIELHRTHTLGIDGGRTAVEDVAEDLESALNATYDWRGNTLHFEGSGATGNIEVAASHVQVTINLNLLLRPMRGQVQAQAEQYLDEHFG